MTLINRVSIFFLLAMGICLLGYSAGMYLLIREHLFHRFDSQLRSSLNVLVAAIEVEPDGVKWQPSDHTISLGNEREEEEVRWMIVNELDQTLGQSHNLISPNQRDLSLLELSKVLQPGTERIRNADQWRFLQHRLTCPEPKSVDERDSDESAELVVTVALDATRLNADLWRLAGLAMLLPVVLWTVAAIAGRSYSRRALRPVEAMATRARSMTDADFDLRLPVSSNQDELSSLAMAFNSLLDRLQQAYQQQQRFTGDAAHQLRTPLTILRGEIDLALRRPRNPEEHRHILSVLSDQTTQLQQIVETLLFLARTENDAVPPDTTPINLSEWLPEYVEQWETDSRCEDLLMEVEPGLSLQTSDSLLRQALDNLVGNALKYSPPGSPVIIRARTSGHRIEIDVEDRGDGIPPEEREAVFEPFFRSVSARKAGIAGTGLGLSIVARIARALGGEISCSSATPHGSRFTLQLGGGKQQTPDRQRELKIPNAT